MTVEELLKQLEEEQRMYVELADADYHKMKAYIGLKEYGNAAHHEYLCVQEQAAANKIEIAIRVIKERVS